MQKPSIPKGTRDFSPSEVAKQKRLWANMERKEID